MIAHDLEPPTFTYKGFEEVAGWMSPGGLAQVKTEEPSEDFYDKFDKWFRQLSKDE